MSLAALAKWFSGLYASHARSLVAHIVDRSSRPYERNSSKTKAADRIPRKAKKKWGFVYTAVKSPGVT